MNDEGNYPNVNDVAKFLEEKSDVRVKKHIEANRFSIKDCLSLPVETKTYGEFLEPQEKEEPLVSARERKSLEMDVINETNSSVIKHFDSILTSSPSSLRKGQGLISPAIIEESNAVKSSE